MGMTVSEPTTSGPTTRSDGASPASARWIIPLVGAAAAIGAGTLVASPAAPAAYWLLALWAAWLATMVWALAARQPSLAVAGLEFFLLLEVVGPATLAVVEGRTYIGIYEVTEGTVGALQLSVLAQVAVLVGALAARAWHPAVHPVKFVPRISAARLDRWSVILLAVAVACLVAYVVIARGDPRSLVVLVGEAKYNDFLKSADGPLVKYFSSLVGLAGVAIVVAGLRMSSLGFRRAWVPIGVVLVSMALLTSGGGRWFLVIPGVATALVWWRMSPGAWTRHPRTLLLVGTAGLFVFAVLVGGLRDQSGEKSIDVGAFVDKQVRGGTFATTAVLVMTVPDHYAPLNGSSYAEVLAMPVPRALWPDKPEGATKDLQRTFFRSEIGASFPFYGESYANFGWWGTAIACGLFGFALESVWVRLLAARRAWQVIVWAALVPTLLQMFSRGYLAGLIAGVFGFLLGVGLVARALSRRERRPAERAEAHAPAVSV